VSDPRRMLCVFAHPDDESYGPGGTIARYAIEGAQIYLLTFTCGEAGTIGISKELSRERLCQRRVDELAAACAALGIAEHYVLGAPDRGLPDIDPRWAVERIARDILEYRPQVLLTFHHRGISQHADHIAVAGYVEEAFDLAAREGPFPAKLYGYGITHRMAGLHERRNLAPMEDGEIDAVIEIPDAAMDRKLEAIRRHETQYDFYLRLAKKFDYRRENRREHFHLRRTRLPRPQAVETDLFAGIDL
jgi:LmbE family N-acetylglucosaminyl deacetylase